MRIKSFIFNPFNVNTYILSDESSGEGLIVDCACSTKAERKRICDYLSFENIELKYAFNTHLHFDHVLGNRWLFDTYGIQPIGHKCDEYCIEWNKMTSVFLPLSNEEKRTLLDFDRYLWIDEGHVIWVGNTSFRVMHTPGHTPGSCSLFCEEKQLLIDGDVLFLNGIGRTDLEMGDAEVMKITLGNLLGLPDETLILPGHGNSTTLSRVRQFIQTIICHE